MVNEQVKKIISSVFNIVAEDITLETGSINTKEWDSLGHFKLILEIEATFDVQFTSEEIPGLTSVEAIQKALTRVKVI